jgi:hypothetical protein
MADRVRAACRKLGQHGWINRRQVYFEVDTDTDAEDRSFAGTWQDLIDRGELTRAMESKKAPWYLYRDAAAPRFDVRAKIYRAMHIKGAFCAADIKKLTDADQSYISVVIRKLVKAGDLELTGKVDKTKMFRVRQANDFYLKFVKRKAVKSYEKVAK